jgi:hypothetical protein
MAEEEAGAKLSRDSDATIVSKEEHQVATTERVEAPEKGPPRKRSDEEARRGRRVRTGLEAREVVLA